LVFHTPPGTTQHVHIIYLLITTKAKFLPYSEQNLESHKSRKWCRQQMHPWPVDMASFHRKDSSPLGTGVSEQCYSFPESQCVMNARCQILPATNEHTLYISK